MNIRNISERRLIKKNYKMGVQRGEAPSLKGLASRRWQGQGTESLAGLGSAQ